MYHWGHQKYCEELIHLPSHQKLPERFEERFHQSFCENVSSLILSWDRKDLDTVLAFTKMGVEPMVFNVPVLVVCGKMGRISHCNVQSSLVVFKRMTDERDTIVWDTKSGSDFLEDMAKRDKSAHTRSQGRIFGFCC